MLDAEALYKRGVSAIKNNDFETGRKLLTRSLKLHRKNDKAWVWIARTYNDPAQQIKCLERAHAINPNNPRTLETLNQIRAKSISTHALSGSQQAQINRLLQDAEKALNHNDAEGAVSLWVKVLDIEVDHPEAIKQAVKTLIKLRYHEDAEELLWRAIDSNTTQVAIYHTAYDMAERNHGNDRLDAIRRKLMQMPDTHDTLFIRMAQNFLDTSQQTHAIKSLERALRLYPDHQKLLVLMGDAQSEMGYAHQAVVYYNRAAKISTSTPEGKEADKKLQAFPPVLTDKERGSTALAWREVCGIFFLYVLLVWQDVGLNFANINAQHIIGLLISVIGAYLLITATSSPQQTAIARRLGGYTPESRKARLITEQNGALQETSQLAIIPQTTRFILGGVGLIILAIAFVMVFGASIDLLLNPIDPPSPIIPGF